MSQTKSLQAGHVSRSASSATVVAREQVPVTSQTKAIHDSLQVDSRTDAPKSTNAKLMTQKPAVMSQQDENLPDLDVWLDVTRYHDRNYRDTTIRKYRAQKVLAEKRKAFEDAQAELDKLLQKPEDNAGDAPQLSDVDLSASIKSEVLSGMTASMSKIVGHPPTGKVDTLAGPQTSSGAKRTRSISPALDMPAKRQDQRERNPFRGKRRSPG